jgi:hypothetical protein
MNPAWRTFTALAAGDGKIATKTHTLTDGKWETTGYTAGYTFRHSAKVLNGLDDLGAALEALSGKPGWFAIRGNVKPGAPDLIQRTYRNADSWIEDIDKMWLAIDIDGQPADPSRDHVEQAIALMPDWLQEADCVWRFSSSHGVKPANQLRLHLWYWLAGPIGNNALRHWARPLPIDGALYQPVQPHYTATPIFIAADDPVSSRLGYHRSTYRYASPYLKDDPLLASPAFETYLKWESEDRAKEKEAKHKVMVSMTPATRRTSWDDQRRYERIVQEEVRKIETCPEGGRHDLIFHAAKSVASLANASPAFASAKPRLEAAALSNLPLARHKEGLRRVDEGWQAGLANQRTLMPLTNDDDALDGWGLADPKPKIVVPPEGILLEDLFR